MGTGRQNATDGGPIWLPGVPSDSHVAATHRHALAVMQCDGQSWGQTCCITEHGRQ